MCDLTRKLGNYKSVQPNSTRYKCLYFTMKFLLFWALFITSALYIVHGQEIEETTRRHSRLLLKTTMNPLYPSNVWVPHGLSFSCAERTPGYYSDSSPTSRCQAYHLCMPDGRQYTMLCGIGTVFNQRTFVCDHWYSYNCANAERDSELNNELWEEFLLPSSHNKALAVSGTNHDEEVLEIDEF